MPELLSQLLVGPGSEGDLLIRVSRAVLFVLIGLLAAWLVRRVLSRILRGSLRLITTRFPVATVGTSRVNHLTVQLVPQFAFWFIFLAFLALSTEALELPFLTAWMSRVLNYLPTLLTAVLLILAGVWGGIALKETITRMAGAARLPYARLLGRAGQTAVVVVAVVIAASQLGVDISFLLVLTGILLGTLLFSVALAFGLGARTMVSNIISCHYLRGLYRIGNIVEVDGVRGNIIKITGAFVVIETETGQVCVPAKQFSQRQSKLIHQSMTQHDH